MKHAYDDDLYLGLYIMEAKISASTKSKVLTKVQVQWHHDMTNVFNIFINIDKCKYTGGNLFESFKSLLVKHQNISKIF